MSDGPSRILLVEDNPGDAFLVGEFLAEAGVSADVTHCIRLSDALSGLESGRPDVVLLDLSLPDASGLQGVQSFRAAAPDLPLVILSGQGDDEVALAAVQAGAQDYLVKGRIDGPLLARSIRYAMERARAGTAIEEQNRLLAERTRLLEQRNAEQEAFIYTVSHDLRQPLLSIQGMAELLEESVAASGDEETVFLSRRIRANVSRMSSLLDGLLTLSRVGRSAPEAQVVDLGLLVDAAMAELEALARQRGATVELPHSWPTVWCSPTEGQQLLANLLSNAVKNAGRAGVPPLVRLSWQNLGDVVQLLVDDNGPGVPPAMRERVFELFRKLDPASSGTGVGLAIVRRIAERHSGQAWVEDSPLGGARFMVSLPVGEQGPPEAAFSSCAVMPAR